MARSSARRLRRGQPAAIVATIPRSPYDVDGLNYTQVWTMFGNELSGMITGGTSIDAGIRDTQSQGSSILAQ